MTGERLYTTTNAKARARLKPTFCSIHTAGNSTDLQRKQGGKEAEGQSDTSTTKEFVPTRDRTGVSRFLAWHSNHYTSNGKLKLI